MVEEQEDLDTILRKKTKERKMPTPPADSSPSTFPRGKHGPGRAVYRHYTFVCFPCTLFTSLFCLTVALPDSLGTRRAKVVVRTWARVYFHHDQQSGENRRKSKTCSTGSRGSVSRFRVQISLGVLSRQDQNKLPPPRCFCCSRLIWVSQIAPDPG